MNIEFPFQIAPLGRTALTDREDHIRDLIKQVLFTTPGERVNRPDFGSGLYQVVFEPNSTELVSTVQFLVTGALQKWLSEVIEVVNVTVEMHESTLTVKVSYRELKTQNTQIAIFQRSI